MIDSFGTYIVGISVNFCHKLHFVFNFSILVLGYNESMGMTMEYNEEQKELTVSIFLVKTTEIQKNYLRAPVMRPNKVETVAVRRLSVLQLSALFIQ